MSKKRSVESVINEMVAVHGKLVVLDVETYVDTKHACRFIDVEFGEWWSIPKRVMKGASHPQRSKQKRRKTCIEKYGSSNVLHSQHGVALKTSTWLQKYGVDNPSKAEVVKNKKRETTQKHYGVDSPAQSQIVQSKIQKTSMKKYGVSHHMKTQEKRMQVSIRNTNRIVSLETRKKHRANALKQMKNGLKSRGIAGVRDDVGFYRSRWEANFARILQYENLVFKYEPITYDLSSGISYTPDFSVSEVLFEIKGWMDERSERQIREFRSEHPDKYLFIIGPHEYNELTAFYKSKIARWE